MCGLLGLFEESDAACPRAVASQGCFAVAESLFLLALPRAAGRAARD